MDTKEILNFLKELEKHNTKDWFHEHSREYQYAKRQFIDLVQELIFHISKFDPSVADLDAKELIFRINRDTRFSKNKAPYQTCFRAHISSGGRAPFPVGYYLHLTHNGETFLGGGIFAAQFTEVTARIRNDIHRYPDEFLSVINNPDFSSRFQIMGEKLKKVPKDFSSDHPCSEYLKHKSWMIEYQVSDAVVIDSDRFIKEAALIFQAMMPFHRFLNTALDGYIMPKR